MTRQGAIGGPQNFGTIVADPPWDYGKDHDRWVPVGGDYDKRRPIPYPSMSLDAIKALPVVDLAARDAALWLWTTNKFLPAAFEVIEAWGFSYRQTFTWKKQTPAPWGGSAAPIGCEFLLFAKRGRPKVGRAPASVIEARAGRHSAKPEAFLDMIESISPEPRLEMFARRNRMGWSTWGNEAFNHVEVGA